MALIHLDECRYGDRSNVRLGTASAPLVRLFDHVIRVLPANRDITIVWGYRGEQDQNQALAEGHSEKPFPESAHNVMPSRAVDAAPYPIRWKDRDGFMWLRGVVELVALQLGIRLKPMIPWDPGHYELEDE